jgi:hypothetical protein
MSETYIFPYTAEEIEKKLELVDANKNLLPYPYNITFPSCFEDVGDGSVLTTADTLDKVPEQLLKSLELPAGTYIASVEAADVATETATECNFMLMIDGHASDASSQFTLSAKETVSVYLVSPTNGFTAGLLIKPMIREVNTEAGWVPYMKTVSSYIDERFNGTAAKIKVLTKRIDTLAVEGSGLPNPSDYPDGSILVVRNGAWVIETPFADGVVLLTEDEAK